MQYEFVCEDCKLIYEGKGSMAKPPKKKKCPRCHKFNNRAYLTPPAVHFATNDFDFETNRARNEKFIKEGMDKDTANEFYETSIKNSKKHVESGGSHYTKWAPNFTELENRGVAKKVSQDEAKVKREEGKYLSRKLHDLAKVEPKDTTHQSI